MPYSLRKTKGGWGVLNTDTGKWKSRDTSKTDAQQQMNLLRGVKHGFKPTGKAARK